MYSEAEKELKWKRHARGRGLRWQIQRDIACMLSQRPLTSMEIQDVMILKRGISHKKITELLGEMEQAGAVEQIREREAYYWRTTEIGVTAYLGTRKAIPAKVAEELWMLSGARELER